MALCFEKQKKWVAGRSGDSGVKINVTQKIPGLLLSQEPILRLLNLQLQRHRCLHHFYLNGKNININYSCLQNLHADPKASFC
jgi:hypothetical protein